jgi:Flp pilus assembly protein TadG
MRLNVRTKNLKRTRGNSIIEVTFMAPWILFLMMGIFDFGFWAFSAISTANAARAAALYTSQDWSIAGDSQRACDLVKQEMNYMLNASQFNASCSSGVLQVTAVALDGSTTPASADGHRSSQVTVRYEVIPLFWIPGLSGRWGVTRVAEMRVPG